MNKILNLEQNNLDRKLLVLINFCNNIGYQVLDKYLKDRKNKTLTLDEIDNIENTVKILTFTIRQMELIDNETKEWI